MGSAMDAARQTVHCHGPKDGAFCNLYCTLGKNVQACGNDDCMCARDELGRVVLGDVITAIDGRPTKLQRELFEVLDEKRPGDTIKVEVLRGSERKTIPVTLGGRDVVGTE